MITKIWDWILRLIGVKSSGKEITDIYRIWMIRMMVILSLSGLWFVRLVLFTRVATPHRGPLILEGLDYGWIGRIRVGKDSVELLRRGKFKPVGTPSGTKLFGNRTLFKVGERLLRLSSGHRRLWARIYKDDLKRERFFITTYFVPSDESEGNLSPLIIDRRSLPRNIGIDDGARLAEVDVQDSLVFTPLYDDLFTVRLPDGSRRTLPKNVPITLTSDEWVEVGTICFQAILTEHQSFVTEPITTRKEIDYINANPSLATVYRRNQGQITRSQILQCLEIYVPSASRVGWRLVDQSSDARWALPFGTYDVTGEKVRYSWFPNGLIEWLVPHYRNREAEAHSRDLVENGQLHIDHDGVDLDPSGSSTDPYVRAWVNRYRYLAQGACFKPTLRIEPDDPSRSSVRRISSQDGWLSSLDKDGSVWIPAYRIGNDGLWYPTLPDGRIARTVFFKPTTPIDRDQRIQTRIVWDGTVTLHLCGNRIFGRRDDAFVEFDVDISQYCQARRLDSGQRERGLDNDPHNIVLIFEATLADNASSSLINRGLAIRMDGMPVLSDPTFWSWSSRRALGWERRDSPFAGTVVEVGTGRLWGDGDSLNDPTSRVRFFLSQPLPSTVNNPVLELTDFPGEGWLFIGWRCYKRLSVGDNRIQLPVVRAGQRVGLEVKLQERKTYPRAQRMLEWENGEITGFAADSDPLLIPAALARERRDGRGRIIANRVGLPWVKVESGITGLKDGTVLFLLPTEDGFRLDLVKYSGRTGPSGRELQLLQNGSGFPTDLTYSSNGVSMNPGRYDYDVSIGEKIVHNGRWAEICYGDVRTRVCRYGIIDVTKDRLVTMFIGGTTDTPVLDGALSLRFDNGRWMIEAGADWTDIYCNGEPISDSKSLICKPDDVILLRNGLSLRLGNAGDTFAWDNLTDGERRYIPGLGLASILGKVGGMGVEEVFDGVLSGDSSAYLELTIDPIAQALGMQEVQWGAVRHEMRDADSARVIARRITAVERRQRWSGRRVSDQYIDELVLDRLRRKLENINRPREGALVLMSSEGELLALAGYPTVPEDSGESEIHQAAYERSHFEPLIPTPLKKIAHPGSVFKILTAAAMLEVRRGSSQRLLVDARVQDGVSRFLRYPQMRGVSTLEDGYVLLRRNITLRLSNFEGEFPVDGVGIDMAFAHSYNTYFGLGIVLNRMFWDNEHYIRRHDGLLYNFWDRCSLDSLGAVQDDPLFALAERIGFNRPFDLVGDRLLIASMFDVRVPGALIADGTVSPLRLAVEASSYPATHFPFIVSMPFCAIGQGEVETTPLQLALMAQMVACDGIVTFPRLVISVSRGEALFKPDPIQRRIISASTANSLSRYMGLVVTEGTAISSFVYDPRLRNVTHAKTGTSESGRSDYPTSVFAGFLDDQDIIFCALMSDSDTGARTAARMVVRTLSKYRWLKSVLDERNTRD